jgi:hypothetical protein
MQIKKEQFMNRKDRREMLNRAVKKLKGAKAYVVVVFDGKTLPVYFYDVGSLNDRGDVRHVAMHKIADNVEKICNDVNNFRLKRLREIKETVKVEQIKQKRSEELAKFNDKPIEAGRTFGQKEVKVAATA